jgi:hypothetical protein
MIFNFDFYKFKIVHLFDQTTCKKHDYVICLLLESFLLEKFVTPKLFLRLHVDIESYTFISHAYLYYVAIIQFVCTVEKMLNIAEKAPKKYLDCKQLILFYIYK